MPFWIDTDGYTDRDREMFVCGYEFYQLYWMAKCDEDSFSITIHRENSSRVRMMLGQLDRAGTVTNCEDKYDPDGTWAYLEVEAHHAGT